MNHNSKSNIWNWFKSSKDETKNNNHSLSIELERQIGEQIYNALQGDIVEEVLREIKILQANGYVPFCI